MVHASFSDVLRTALKCATLLGVVYLLCLPLPNKTYPSKTDENR